ncbi:MAG: hypothetical protein WCV82_03270 [Candidatus Paceibacterota bacterium]
MKTLLLLAAIDGSSFSFTQLMVFLSLAASGLLCLGFAAVFGGHHDGDMDHSGDHGGEGDAPSFLSPRVFFAFLTGFGVAGSIATIYGARAAAATGIGFIPGFIMAFVAWLMAYVMFKQQINSSLRPGQVLGAHGTVVTRIPAGGLGEVNIKVNGQILPYTAIVEEGADQIAAGIQIRVIQDLGDKVVVSRLSAPLVPART